MRGVYTDALTEFSGEPVAILATLGAAYALDEVDVAPEFVDRFERVFVISMTTHRTRRPC